MEEKTTTFRDVPTDLSVDEIQEGMIEVIKHFKYPGPSNALGLPGYKRLFSEFIHFNGDLVPVVPSVFKAMQLRGTWKGTQQIDHEQALEAAKAVGFEIIKTTPSWGLASTTDTNEIVLTNKIQATDLETTRDKVEESGLGGFNPKDDSDYVVTMPAYTLTKSRRHETLVSNFGELAIKSGYVTSTPHPIDLLLQRENNSWIVEAKIVYNWNYAQAVRGAIGQLLEYQHFYRPNARLIALFNVEIGGGYLKLLKTLDIAAVWPVSEGWMSANADHHLLGLPFRPNEF